MSRTRPKQQGARRRPKTSTQQGPASPPAPGGGAGFLIPEEHVTVLNGVVLNTQLEAGENVSVLNGVVLNTQIEAGENVSVLNDVIVETELRETLFAMQESGGLSADDLATGGAGNPHSPTFNGGAHIAAAPSGLPDVIGRRATGAGWLRLPGAVGDFLSYADSADWAYAGDFTIEFILFPNTVAGTQIVLWHGNSNVETERSLLYLNGSTPTFFMRTGGTTHVNITSGVLTAGKVHHVAAQRIGNDFYVSTDGVIGGTVNTATAWPDYTGLLQIGQQDLAANELPFNGFILAMRITKGTALYGSSDFTPPTPEDLVDIANAVLLNQFGDPLLLDTGEGVPIDESTGGVDSPRTLEISGSGIYFENHDGYKRIAFRDDGDNVAGWLRTADSADLRPAAGTGDYCIEAILEVKRDTARKGFFFHGTAVTDNVHCRLDVSGNLLWSISNGGVTDLSISGASGWSVGDVVHVVFEKVGNNYTIYSDGVQIATGVNAVAWPDFGSFAYLGRQPLVVPGNRGDFDLLGYRLSTTSRYGAAGFATVRVHDLVDDANTVLLWRGRRPQPNKGRWGAYGVGGIGTGTPVADPYGGARRMLVFDGTDDYVALMPPANTFGHFVAPPGRHGALDLWIYPTATGTERVIASRYLDANSYWRLDQESNDGIQFHLTHDGVDLINVISAASALTINAWNHIVVDLWGLGGVAVNGTFVAIETTFGAQVVPPFTSQPVYLGTWAGSPGTSLFQGYMADLRARSGKSPYQLTNFTAPSSPPS